MKCWRTESIKAALTKAGITGNVPSGTFLVLGGTGTHKPVIECEINISGMKVADVKWEEAAYLHHRVTDGVIVQPCYWCGIVGGWAEVVAM